MKKEQFNLRFERMVFAMKWAVSFGFNLTTHESQEQKEIRIKEYKLMRATKRTKENKLYKLRKAGWLKKALAVLPKLIARGALGAYLVCGQKFRISLSEGETIVKDAKGKRVFVK